MKKLLYIIIAIFAVIGVLAILRPTKSHADGDKVLVAYFSATGNTRTVAERLANEIGADLFEIQPEAIYSAEDLDWRNPKSRASVEMADKESRPAIANNVADMAQYKVVFVGFPIWWGREPSIVDTFLNAYDFNGKTIVPFATSGSTPSTEQAAENMRTVAQNANILNGARFPVDVSADELKTRANEQQ